MRSKHEITTTASDIAVMNYWVSGISLVEQREYSEAIKRQSLPQDDSDLHFDAYDQTWLIYYYRWSAEYDTSCVYGI